MLLDNPVGQRQAETGSLAYGFGGKERFEDLAHMLRTDALAAILDFNPYIALVKAGTQGDEAVILNGLRGIDQQVHEHLVELRGNAFDLGQAGVLLDNLGLVFDLVPDDVERALQPVFKIG